MDKPLNKALLYLIILALLFNLSSFYVAKAQTNLSESKVLSNTALNTGNNVLLPIAEKELETDEIKDLKNLILNKQQEITSLNSEINKYKDLIKVKQDQASTLESQISILDNQIIKAELDIKVVEAQIEELEFAIKEKEQEIKETEEKLELQKERIAENLRILNRNDDRSYLELLLMNDKFSEFFDSLHSLKNLESELRMVFDNLISLKAELEAKKVELEDENNKLQEKKQELSDNKAKLDDQKYSKEVILEQTVATEKEFRNLIYQVKAEQDQTAAQIKKLEDDVKKRLEAERNKRKSQGQKIDDPTKLSWPIQNQGITTGFHDPDYPFRQWIGEHSGIDIRTMRNGNPTNGIPVKSAADGIVIKIIREGKLSGNVVYVLHDNDIMTVYMHLSRIDATEDQYVSRGEVIGLSGGMPGTPGAGRISTGPHLHFEVRLNGIPVNPMNYLQ